MGARVSHAAVRGLSTIRLCHPLPHSQVLGNTNKSWGSDGKSQEDIEKCSRKIRGAREDHEWKSFHPALPNPGSSKNGASSTTGRPRLSRSTKPSSELALGQTKRSTGNLETVQRGVNWRWLLVHSSRLRLQNDMVKERIVCKPRRDVSV